LQEASTSATGHVEARPLHLQPELPWNPQRQVQETGFFQTLWQGATAAIGVVRREILRKMKRCEAQHFVLFCRK